MKAARLLLMLAPTLLAGCAGSSDITTGSLFGGNDKPVQDTPVNDPPMRAFQVGTVSARAIKCGFNFDPAKLKATYLAFESKQPGAGDMAKIEKIYDVSFNGVAKAVVGETEYCTDEKTKTIKADLARHLAGDYTPSPLPKAPEEEGLLSGWGSGGSDDKGMAVKHPLDNSDI